jgi:hypothetical protein
MFKRLLTTICILNLFVLQLGIIANSAPIEIISKSTNFDKLDIVCINNKYIDKERKEECKKNANDPKFKNYCLTYYMPAPQETVKYDKYQYYIYNEDLKLLRDNCDRLYNVKYIKKPAKSAVKSVVKNVKIATRTLVSYCFLTNPKLPDAKLVICKDKIKSMNTKQKIVDFCKEYIKEGASEFKNCINTPVAKNVIQPPAKPYTNLISMCEEVYKGTSKDIQTKVSSCKTEAQKSTSPDLRNSLCKKRFVKDSTQLKRCLVTTPSKVASK